MFDKVAREFMAIVRHLLQQPDPWIKDDRLLVPRETLIGMLDKHPYLTSTDKLNAWRALHWIEADGEHFTWRVRSEDGVKRVVKMNLKAFRKLTELRQMDV